MMQLRTLLYYIKFSGLYKLNSITLVGYIVYHSHGIYTDDLKAIYILMVQENGSDWSVDSRKSKVGHFTEQTIWKSFQQICTEIPMHVYI